MAPFFSPDPGVSLQPSAVYSTSNSLVIAYVVILPLENILWLQVMNFYCLGSEVKGGSELLFPVILRWFCWWRPVVSLVGQLLLCCFDC